MCIYYRFKMTISKTILFLTVSRGFANTTDKFLFGTTLSGFHKMELGLGQCGKSDKLYKCISVRKI